MIIIHDHCWACSVVITDMICHLLREEEIAEFHRECYEALRAMFDHYEMTVDRQAKRLRPN